MTEEKKKEKDEKEILKQASLGSEEAFGLLYEIYVDRIFNYIYYRTGNVHDAEDLTARVFQRAMKHIPNYQDRGVPFSAWLYRIAHNLVANWHRDRSRKKEVSITEKMILRSKDESPETTIIRTEKQDALLQIIRTLPPDRQQLLILKFVEGYSNKEIGKIMNRSEGAVKSLYHRTLLTLRDQEDDLKVEIEG